MILYLLIITLALVGVAIILANVAHPGRAPLSEDAQWRANEAQHMQSVYGKR